jgi:alpha-N-arabinofuranosidase
MKRVAPIRDTIIVDPSPRFPLSPWHFMQIMEGLGATDGSVEAAWRLRSECWREDVLAAARELGPTLVRWPGGIVSSFYRWRDAIGPRARRVPMPNTSWGGLESNNVGTHEFIDFCRAVGAEALVAVNFEAEGNPLLARYAGRSRAGSPQEAAEWIEYCNRPSHRLRRRNGAAQPFGVRLWQIGNETSYSTESFSNTAAARRTAVFARAMKQADPSIRLIGWGDSGWAKNMLEICGGHIDYLAFHNHFGSALKNSPLQWNDFRDDPAATWRHLMSAFVHTERSIAKMRSQVKGSSVRLAMTESHFALPGRNRCDVLACWAAGVANARILNVHERNGDILDIATLADFFGTTWRNNALMICQPGTLTYLMPVARVMSLFRRHRGDRELAVTAFPPDLDVTASRRGDTVFLHVVNTSRDRAVACRIAVEGMGVSRGRVHAIAADPMLEIDQHNHTLLAPTERPLPRDGRWRFAPASVSAVELAVRGIGPIPRRRP